MDKKITFEGLGVVNPTPFDEKGRVNIEELLRHIDFMLQGGVHILSITAACGEGMKLTDEERRLVTKSVTNHVDGRAYVLAYPTRLSVIETIRLAREAEELGANGIKLMPLPYWLPKPEEIYATMKEVIESINIEVMLYDNVPRAGVHLPVHIVKRLAEEYPQQVVGIKEGEFSKVKELVVALKETRPDFKIMASGVKDCIAVAAIGGHGMVSLLPNVAPQLAFDICNAALDGDFSKARKLYYDNYDLIRLNPAGWSIGVSNPVSSKYQLNLMGWKMGKPRLPDLWPPSSEHQEIFKQALAQRGWLKEDNNPT